MLLQLYFVCPLIQMMVLLMDPMDYMHQLLNLDLYKIYFHVHMLQIYGYVQILIYQHQVVFV